MAARANALRLVCLSLSTAALLAAGGPATAQAPPQLERCVGCHGVQGNSTQPTIPSLAGQPRIFMENQLVLIREGLRDIPPMKGVLDGLSDTDLIALASYFSAQTPARPGGPIDAQRHAQGQALARERRCASCHQTDFSGREQIPRLAGQQETFLQAVMTEYRDHPGPGRDTLMTDVLQGLSDAQLAALAHFLTYSPQAPD